jgi:hypothetical protein
MRLAALVTLALSAAHAFDPGHALSQHKRHRQHTIAKEQHTAAFGRKQGVAVGLSDTAGAVSTSRKRGWNPFPGEVTDADYVPPTSTHTMRLPPHGTATATADGHAYKVAIIVLQMGPLPPFINYFLASCAASAPLVDYLVFHTEKALPAGLALASPLPPNVRLVHIEARDVAKRLQAALGEDYCPADVQKVLDAFGYKSRASQGSKMNDLKPVFGAIFEKELRGYSHWGWSDLDCLMGDVHVALAPYLPKFDVITFPDGGLDAIFTAGQLTVFRNIGYFRSFFKVSFKHVRGYSMAYFYVICEPSNRLWDEKFTIWHALRHAGIRLVADMTAQFGGVAVNGWHEFLLEPATGEISRMWDETRAFEAAQDWDPPKESAAPKGSSQLLPAKVASMANKHECVPWFQGGWSWRCVPRPYDVVYEWADGELTARRQAPRKGTDGPGGERRERGALLHLSSWKDYKPWMISRDGWQSKHWRVANRLTPTTGARNLVLGATGWDGSEGGVQAVG